MKANEAPEKLYFDERDRGILDIYSNKELNDDIEYTRTDAFIEKAAEWLKSHADDYNYTWYNEMEGESGITDKCIEDFKRYMKGE